jgi:hypothetical protein
MTKKEEYELVVKMIDDTQKQISKDPKDKRQLILELEQLQIDLAFIRTKGYPRRQSQIIQKGVTL